MKRVLTYLERCSTVLLTIISEHGTELVKLTTEEKKTVEARRELSGFMIRVNISLLLKSDATFNNFLHKHDGDTGEVRDSQST